jgi:hypothetical protein
MTSSIKLGRLPDRTPVKLTILVSPELHRALRDYAEAYAAAYGDAEPVAELVPAILADFLRSDRAFLRSRKSSGPRS